MHQTCSSPKFVCCAEAEEEKNENEWEENSKLFFPGNIFMSCSLCFASNKRIDGKSWNNNKNKNPIYAESPGGITIGVGWLSQDKDMNLKFRGIF